MYEDRSEHFYIHHIIRYSMKLKISVIACLMLLHAGLCAQMVVKGYGNSNSTFLLGHTSAVHTQCLYLPTDLSPQGMSGDITRIYYRYGDTGEDLGNTLGDLRIRMGQTTATGFQNGNMYYTGLDMVLHEDTYTIAPGVEGDWFSIDLGTPFTYDPSKTLIIDIMFATTTTLNFGTLGTDNDGRKLRSDDTTSTIGSQFPSTTWQDLGLDLETSIGMVQIGRNDGVHVLPNPFASTFDVLLPPGSAVDRLQIMDMTGRTVRSVNINAPRTSFDLGAEPSGIYFLQLTGERSNHVLKVVKE